MSLIERYIEQVEASSLPKETIEAAADALSFAQQIHDTLSDWGIVKNKEVDPVILEQAFESLLGELTAASIFLASFSKVEETLRKTAASASSEEHIPPFVAKGYRKLADRVEKTRQALLDTEE